MVNYGQKEKRKNEKSSLLYNIKTSEGKTERNLNERRFGLNPSFKKEKTKVFSTRPSTINVSQIETLISGI